MVNTEKLDLNKINLDETSCKNVIYFVGYVTPNSVKNK